jgi:hypothetical protein
MAMTYKLVQYSNTTIEDLETLVQNDVGDWIHEHVIPTFMKALT